MIIQKADGKCIEIWTPNIEEVLKGGSKMDLKKLYQDYKAAKIRADQAAKEEEKLKKALKAAMLEAGEKEYRDQDGYLFERIVQNRKSMDEKGLLAELKERGITAGIKTIEAVDEEGVMGAIEAGDYSADELRKFLSVKEVVVLKMTAPGKGKKKVNKK